MSASPELPPAKTPRARRARLVFLAIIAAGCIASYFMTPRLSGDLRGRQVYIVPGYGATSSDHWFGWLAEQLRQRGAAVTVFDMPDSMNPDPQIWQRFLQANVKRHDAKTYFVGHSLGCVALLRYLQSLPADTQVGGLLLVAGFVTPIKGLPQLDPFVIPPPELSKVGQIVRQRVTVASRNDNVVPYELGVELSRELGAQLVTVDDGGHFLATDGYSELPQAYDQLALMAAQ